MNEPYWEVNDDEYEVIDMDAEEKLCNELITKGQAFQVIADNNSGTKMTLACYDALLDGIAKAKAVDIVHRKECKHRIDETIEGEEVYTCLYRLGTLILNGYCDMGERKTE